MPEPTQEELAAFELQAAAVASNIAQRCVDIPAHIMAAALGILFASMVVDRDTYISESEMASGTLLTEDDTIQRIVADIKARAEFIRMAMKAAGIGSRAQ